MNDFERLKETVETNFRLNSLEAREVAARLDGRVTALSQHMNQMAAQMGHMATEMAEMSTEFREGMERQADRMDQAVVAIGQLGDGGVELRQDIADLKRRVQRLEDLAS